MRPWHRAMVTTGVLGDMGGSLPVQNVKELASKYPEYIPLRYIRPEVESDDIVVDGSLQTPVIDMSNFVMGQVGYEEELTKLHTACKEWGFFQLINHGASEAIEHMKVVTEEFFKLPLEEKMACAQVPNNIEGYGQAFVVSEDQKLDWGDMLFILPLPASRRNLSFWPQNPTSFKSTLEEYSSKLQSISTTLLGLMAKNLGVNPEELTSKFEDCIQGIRTNYYPPCVHADKVMGLAPHSDSVGLTLLIHVNEVQGLQIRKNHKWHSKKSGNGLTSLKDYVIRVKEGQKDIFYTIGESEKAVKNALFKTEEERAVENSPSKAEEEAGLKLDDEIEEEKQKKIMSNGEYSSIEHRAMVNVEQERLSIAAFHSPNMEAEIGPLPDFAQKTGAKYKQ
ncbi:hypothetical protein RJ639_026494 [Escallonia herrerae]|uniref:Fe2OG dioxygenase domain-containing protein n=1 Tax=Escallonia herrerae TaxID=1293975 RepID=A0AA88S553_9ASTE|nr:hypothetical protein RJ639_026494 [Escallonia herrerae]